MRPMTAMQMATGGAVALLLVVGAGPLFRTGFVPLLAAFALLAIGAGQAPAQSGNRAAEVDLERVGPQVGTGLPDFSLRDQHGDVHTMGSLLGPNGALIVFFRSADW